jgi:hypothetical protein
MGRTCNRLVTTLSKWDVLRVTPPGVGHTKFAVCICPIRLWFFYINSERPSGRKRAPLAIEMMPFQGQFLRKASFLDTTQCPDLDRSVIEKAVANQSDCLGPLLPSIRSLVVACVRQHGVLEPAQARAVLEGEA